jgi:hypothetical protein
VHNEVSKLRELLTRDKLSQSDITAFMVNMRLLLERGNLKHKYRVLNLYCNWFLHVEIDRDREAVRVLGELVRALIDAAKTDAGSEELHSAIAQAISCERLRLDIISVLGHYGLPDICFRDPAVWHSLLSVLLGILIDRPLIAPSHTKQVASSANPLQTDIWNWGGIHSFSFVTRCDEATGGRAQICWQIVVGDPRTVPLTFSGPLVLPKNFPCG